MIFGLCCAVYLNKDNTMTTANFENIGLDSVNVANAIRYAAQQRGLSINMTQINKLLYIAYGSLLVYKKKRLTEEHPSAWPYGPVFPRVHRHVKLSDNITGETYKQLEKEDSSITRLIDNVVDKFGKLSATQLSTWSHQEGSPWDIAVKESNGIWNTKLDDEIIYNYFYSFLNIQSHE